MGCDWTDSGASTEEHESRQGTGAIWGHKQPYKGCIAGATGVKELFQICESIEQGGKSSGPRVIPYRYIKVRDRRCPNGGQT